MSRLKLNHVSKRGHWRKSRVLPNNNIFIFLIFYVFSRSWLFDVRTITWSDSYFFHIYYIWMKILEGIEYQHYTSFLATASSIFSNDILGGWGVFSEQGLSRSTNLGLAPNTCLNRFCYSNTSLNQCWLFVDPWEPAEWNLTISA